MNQSNIAHSFGEFPIQYQERKRTDFCCTILSSLLVLTLFILACVSYNPSVINRWRYVSDSAGRTCGHDHRPFPYLYFASINDPSKRLCLSECPAMGDRQVHSYESTCKDCILDNQRVDLYDTNLEETMMGKFCFPTDSKIKENLILKGGIHDRYRVLQSYKAVGISLLVALALGIVYVLLVQTFPLTMINVSVIAGAVSTIILGIALMVFKSEAYPTLRTFRYILGVISILFGAILIGMLIVYRQQLRIMGIFILQAGNYLKENRTIFLLIPVFIVLTYLVLGLGFFQFLAFFSKGEPFFTGFSPYFEVKSTFGSGFLNLLNIFAIFWGLNFLRQASVFISSGFIIGWYSQKSINPVKNLFKHWGSVVACGFMVGFFGIVDMLYLFVSPNQSATNGCAQATKKILLPCQSLSRFIREEAMAYINLTGLAYCNSSTYCQYLTNRSDLSKREGNKPIVRYYRYGAYSFLISLVLLFVVIFQNSTIGVVPLLSVVTSGVLSLYMVSGFIDIHADMGSALLLAYTLEQNLEGRVSLPRGQQLNNRIHQILNSSRTVY